MALHTEKGTTIKQGVDCVIETNKALHYYLPHLKHKEGEPAAM
jgi:hypothetical protein